jgi:hypothetical protein
MRRRRACVIRIRSGSSGMDLVSGRSSALGRGGVFHGGKLKREVGLLHVAVGREACLVKAVIITGQEITGKYDSLAGFHLGHGTKQCRSSWDRRVVQAVAEVVIGGGERQVLSQVDTENAFSAPGRAECIDCANPVADMQGREGLAERSAPGGPYRALLHVITRLVIAVRVVADDIDEVLFVGRDGWPCRGSLVGGLSGISGLNSGLGNGLNLNRPCIARGQRAYHDHNDNESDTGTQDYFHETHWLKPPVSLAPIYQHDFGHVTNNFSVESTGLAESSQDPAPLMGAVIRTDAAFVTRIRYGKCSGHYASGRRVAGATPLRPRAGKVTCLVRDTAVMRRCSIITKI